MARTYQRKNRQAKISETQSLEDQSPKNPIVPKNAEEWWKLENLYSETDKEYVTYLQQRFEVARDQKSGIYPEFRNKTYYQYYEENEKIGNTYLPGKKNDDDVVVSAGTIEQKLDSILSHLNNLNLSPEVLAFDRENNPVVALGTALTDIIHDCDVRDGGDGAGDEEKKLLRQRELLKQGTVFVQDEWLRRFETRKKLKKEFDGKFKQDADFYSETLELVFEGPSRTMLYGPNVYLGNITQFYMEKQPFLFVSIVMDYEDAKATFGKFDNFKYVIPGHGKDTDANAEKTIYDGKWRLNTLKANQVEVLLYQDQPNDEFQIQINSCMMLPIGFPLSAVSPLGKYNIVKQVYRVLNEKFAYGGSFVASGSVKELSNLLDEMLKLAVLKTRKSITPAYVNTSGRVIDKKVLSPGRISMGIDPQALQAIAGNEVQGVTAGETQYMIKLQEMIDKSTVSDQFTGQQGPAGTTATEVNIIQQQARLTLGLTVAACMLLEKKLAWLRLYIVLANYFEPTGDKARDIQGARELLSSYRKVTRTNAPIPGEGPGERSVILQDGELPDSDTVRDYERAEEEERGVPIRKIFINPENLKNAGFTWYIVVNARERESSPFFKAMFRELLADMTQMMQFGSMPNKEGLEDELSRIWGKPRNKLFASMAQNPAMAGLGAMGGAPSEGGRASAPSSGGMAPGSLMTAAAGNEV